MHGSPGRVRAPRALAAALLTTAALAACSDTLAPTGYEPASTDRSSR